MLCICLHEFARKKINTDENQKNINGALGRPYGVNETHLIFVLFRLITQSPDLGQRSLSQILYLFLVVFIYSELCLLRLASESMGKRFAQNYFFSFHKI